MSLALRHLEDGMRVKILDWDTLVAKYGLNDKGNINCTKGFLPQMKHLCGRIIEVREEMIRQDRMTILYNDEVTLRKWYITSQVYELEYAPSYPDLVPGMKIKVKDWDKMAASYGLSPESNDIRLPGGDTFTRAMRRFCDREFWVNDYNIGKLSNKVFMLVEENGDVWDFPRYTYEVIPGEVQAEHVSSVVLEPEQKAWMLDVIETVFVASLRKKMESVSDSAVAGSCANKLDAVNKIKQLIAQE